MAHACLASENVEKNNIHTQSQKLRGSILKYAKCNEIWECNSSTINYLYVCVNHETLKGTINSLLGTT